MLKLQHHEKDLIKKLEQVSSAKIPENDINMFIRVLRRHSRTCDAVRVAEFKAESEAPELFRNCNTFLFIQDGKYHKEFDSVDSERAYLIIQTRTGRETAIGVPIYDVMYVSK